MQGFNKYYPPDYDGEKHGSLNAYRGKHALGDRARKLDEGILIVRFELPFNIWCGSCGNHIGMGVRYNAEKKKIGNYYSTPIYSFRCKCHVCSGWFEIHTDPKNTRYVVVSGARQKEEEWDPEENGGFAVHETDPNAPPLDPLAALEKTTAAQTHMDTVQVPRLEALQDLSEHYSADPYAMSRKVRGKFRVEKKIAAEKKAADDELKAGYALPAELALAEENEESRKEAHEQWEVARREAKQRDAKRRRVDGRPMVGGGTNARTTPSARASSSAASGSPAGGAVSALKARILGNTAARVAGSRSSGIGPQRTKVLANKDIVIRR